MIQPCWHAGPCSRATWCSSLSAKPVVYTWSTIHGQAPSSRYLSRFLKLKICGKKHSVCSIVGSRSCLTSSWAGGLNSDQVDQTTLPEPKPQGVILVTEHNAEVNAGFAVLRGSNHAPPLLEEDWQRIPLNSGESHEPVIREYV